MSRGTAEPQGARQPRLATFNMSKIPYDSARPDMKLLRLAVFERLRLDRNWSQLPVSAHDFDPYIDHVHPGRAHVLILESGVKT